MRKRIYKKVSGDHIWIGSRGGKRKREGKKIVGVRSVRLD
jgi:hypothetical protein